MEVVTKEGRNSFSSISQAVRSNLKTAFYTIALQPALGTLHNACTLKLPLVTGAFGTDITESYMFKELCCSSGDAKALKSQ